MEPTSRSDYRPPRRVSGGAAHREFGHSVTLHMPEISARTVVVLDLGVASNGRRDRVDPVGEHHFSLSLRIAADRVNDLVWGRGCGLRSRCGVHGFACTGPTAASLPREAFASSSGCCRR